MRAAVIRSFGGPEVLEVMEREGLIPGPKEVLLDVKAAGINRPDVFQRKGNYPAPAGAVADIPGLEVSGVVKALGAEVKELKIGDEVFALLAGGGYATEVCVDEGLCIRKPINLSFEDAASLPETLFTVWHNVFQRGGLKKGDRLLVHGGSGGIGSMAIQLATQFGTSVYCTVGNEEKAQFALKMGAVKTINYHQENFESELKDFGINIILDSIGGSYFEKNLNLLIEDGRLIQINATEGAKVNLNLLKLMQKRILLTGSTLRARDVDFKRALTKEIKEQVIPLFAKGNFQSMLTKVFTLEEVVQAHQYFDSYQHFGKIVLIMNG
ncbi:NAD(P)H-quinone oxidoreductase [Sphingobacterium kyonggiense]|uniref:NAD(P)H-quinone oxidoreductase n=1 Tax=Sphingobacterium kyonggiense TaxID=714075 RepID=A0ABP7YUL1_9SPHI